MSDLKTRETEADPLAFLASVDAGRRADCETLLQLLESVTGEKAKMWGAAMIGFGSYHYRYESGREGDWFLAGFSPRKQNLTIYIMSGFDNYDALLATLGKYKTGKSCLYVKTLADIDLTVLRQLIEESVAHMKKVYS